jgi:hypothetical protein
MLEITRITASAGMVAKLMTPGGPLMAQVLPRYIHRMHVNAIIIVWLSLSFSDQ